LEELRTSFEKNRNAVQTTAEIRQKWNEVSGGN